MLVAVSGLLLSLVFFRLGYIRVKKQGSKRDGWVFLVGCLLAFYLTIGMFFELPVPKMNQLFEFLFKPIAEPIGQYLKGNQVK